MIYLSQISLITAILLELDTQEPGVTVTQHQMNTIIKAVNAIQAAMMYKPQPETLHGNRA